MKPALNKTLLLSIAFFVAVLCVWELSVRALSIPVYVLPTPSAILRSLITNFPVIVTNLETTSIEAALGFLAGSVAGLFFGVLLAESKLLGRLLLPYIVGSNAVPVVAIAPLVVLWFGNGLLSKVVVSAFLCFFPLSINTYRGLSETPALFNDLFRIYGGTRREFLFKARFPFAAPYIFTGAKLNATFAVIGAIVAEFIGAASGLGFGMLSATYNLDVPRLWAYLVISVALGMLAYSLIWGVERLVNIRHE